MIEQCADFERELTNEKIETLRIIMEQNFEALLRENKQLNEKLDHITSTLMNAQKRERPKIYVNEKLTPIAARLLKNKGSKVLTAPDKRADNFHRRMVLQFTLFGILLVVVPIAVAVVQSFIQK